MRFLLDEMYSPAIAAGLRGLGVDAEAVKERAELISYPDPELLRVAAEEQRVLVSENVKDFRRIHREHLEGGGQHAGIIHVQPERFPRPPKNSVSVLIRALMYFISDRAEYVKDLGSFEWWLETVPDSAT